MPRRVVIHPGFHKTGTTTIQGTLRLNRPLLKPYLRSVMKAGLQDCCSSARGYSTWRDPISRNKFYNRFQTALQGIAPMPKRVLVLSSEELSGHLPGRDGLPDYSAALELVHDMTELVAQVMPEAELIYYYSTRAAEPWLRSAYWQHVRASSMTLDFEDYQREFQASANLDGVVDAVSDSVDVRVERGRLEDTAGLPAGPATSLLDLCDVPRDVQARMQLETRNANLGPDVLATLLNINRTIHDPDERIATKKAILDEAEGNAHDG